MTLEIKEIYGGERERESLALCIFGDHVQNETKHKQLEEVFSSV